jgi:hypothetical protein
MALMKKEEVEEASVVVVAKDDKLSVKPTNVGRVASLQNKNEQDRVDSIMTFDDNNSKK